MQKVESRNTYMILHLAGSPQHTHSKSLHFPKMKEGWLPSQRTRRWVLQHLEVHCIGILVAGKTGRLAVYRNLENHVKVMIYPFTSYQIICEQHQDGLGVRVVRSVDRVGDETEVEDAELHLEHCCVLPLLHRHAWLGSCDVLGREKGSWRKDAAGGLIGRLISDDKKRNARGKFKILN